MIEVNTPILPTNYQSTLVKTAVPLKEREQGDWTGDV